MKGYRHREAKGYQYSSRQMALSYISNVVTNKSKTQEPFKLSHTSTRKSRKQIKKQHKRQNGITNENHQKTIVAYGNGSIVGTMRCRFPIPVKVIFLHEAPNLAIINVFSLQKTLEAIAKQALVILIDEFRTSVTCSTCHSELENSYREQNFLCNHR
jgi:transposase